MYCSEHYICEHEEPWCQCISCSGADSQCPFAFNFKQNVQTMDLGESSVDTGIKTNDNQLVGKIDLHCAEEIRSAIPSEGDTGRISPRPYGIEAQTSNELYPHLQNSAGTIEQLRFSFPSVNKRGWDKAMANANEYFESTNQKKTVSRNSGIPNNEFQDTVHLDTNGQREDAGQMLENNDDRGGNFHNNNAPKNESEHDGNCISSVAIQGNSTVGPSMLQSGIDDNSGPTAKDGTTGGGGESSPKKKGHEQNIQKTEKNCYWTFIVHKRHLAPGWTINIDRKRNGPFFITFDHGDHLHVSCIFIYP